MYLAVHPAVKINKFVPSKGFRKAPWTFFESYGRTEPWILTS